MSGNPVADQVWWSMSSLVLDNKDGWRRAVVDRTGLPFSRIRILRRLASQPMTVKEVAEAATIDAPAATVAVNDLEARGLVDRQPHPDNRRCKLVSLTEAGRDVIAVLDDTDDPAPAALAALDEQDLQALQRILARLIS
jgi:DNA-binding MarR family transcriptional regulator